MTEDKADTRPETSASFVTFQNGMAKKKAEAFEAWIREKEIKRSQIISITMNETQVTEGEQLLTVFYRDAPIEKGELPFAELLFEQFNKNQSWDRLLKEANKSKSGEGVVSLSHSAKNIGEARN